MRIDNKVFGERTPFFGEQQNPISKYILVYEGECTEVQYFNGIIKYKNELGINPLIDLRPVLRSFSQLHDSSAKAFIESLIEYLYSSLDNGITVSYLTDAIIDYIVFEEKLQQYDILVSPKKIKLELNDFICEKYNIGLNDSLTSLEEVVKSTEFYLKRIINNTPNSSDIIDYIYDQETTYDSDVDTVCIILDRDKAEHYDYIFKTCKQYNFNLYITNPCFEFWLLLHSDKVFEYDKEKILSNRKINKNKRFLEQVLSDIYGGYRKEKIDFLNFKDNIMNAIKNEKKFCQDIKQLKNELGCNIGTLMDDLMK